MKFLLKKYFIVTFSIYALSFVITGFHIKNGFGGLLYSSFILGILMFIAKPIVDLIMLPINILSLNLTKWLFNIFLVYIWTILVSGDIIISPWKFSGFSLGPLTITSFILAKWQVIVVSGIILTLLIRTLDEIMN